MRYDIYDKALTFLAVTAGIVAVSIWYGPRVLRWEAATFSYLADTIEKNTR